MKMKVLVCVLLSAIFTLSGCTLNPLLTVPENANESESAEANAEVLLQIDHADGPVTISTEGSGEFEGCEDTIQGSKITHNGTTPLVAGVSTCADFGDHFGGSYSVFGNENTLKNTIFRFAPPEQRDEAISCGVNYFDLIMRGDVLKCESVRILYGKQMILEQVSGEFSMMVFPLSDHCPLQFSAQMFTLNGSVEGIGTVSLVWDKDHFLLESEQPFSALEITTGSANHIEEQTVYAEGGTSYEIRIADGAPVVQDREHAPNIYSDER